MDRDSAPPTPTNYGQLVAKSTLFHEAARRLQENGAARTTAVAARADVGQAPQDSVPPPDRLDASDDP